jgi:hypothetical protein
MKFVPRLFLAVAAFAVAALAGAHGTGQDAAPTPKAAPAASTSSRAQSLTLDLMTAAKRYNTATPGQKGQLLAELTTVAKDRHDELIALIAADPAEVLRLALPPEIRAGLPAQAIPFLEQPADETGVLDVFHVDHVNQADDYYVHFLTTPKTKFSLYFAGAAPDIASGTRVRVRGVRIDDVIVAAGGADVMVVKAVSVLGNTLGAQKTLTILVNFSDAPTAQPYTPTQAQNVVFGTTSSYDYEASYQQTTLTGTVAGWFTIAETSATCNYTNIASQAKQAATAAGVVLSNFNRYVYVFPANACTWWGLGSVGGNPSQAWIHTKWGLTLGVVGHEMGHNFGLYHSHSLDCGTAAVAASGCTTSEYGDVFDVMGNSSAAHFNAYHKERLGWLNAGVSPPLTTVPAQSGTTTYAIAPIENARDGVPRALKIPRGTSCTATSEWFYVESRQAKGFDSFLSGNANVLGGVLIHKITDGSIDSSYLLDMTPATASWTDAALVAGQSFVDPLTGLTITPTSVSASGAQVSVTYPPATCTPAAPKMTYTPTGTVWTSAGTSVTYAVSVTNQDSCGCAATSYEVSANVPGGWGATKPKTSSISPGASTSTSLAVTVPPGTAAGLYNLAVNAANTAAMTLTTSGPSTIAIADALVVSTVTDKAGYTMPTQGNTTVNALITTTVKSSGAPVSGASVSVAVREPGGKTTTLAGTTGSTGTSTVTYAMRSKNAAKGTYTVTSKATMGSMVSTATTAFLVN